MDAGKVREQIIQSLQTVFDPEIPVNVYDLGLIYDVDVNEEGFAHVRMTLTAPNCPAAQYIPEEVERKTRGVEGVTGARVDVVWEPMWTPDKMTDAAKLQLGML